MHKIKVEQFEGPLDLLLQLIENQKLEITKVSLAQVTEQYIKILNKSAKEKIKAEELADFLVIASRLLLIKSKALLPFLQWDEEDQGEELTGQLKIYKQYLEASKLIQSLIAKKNFSWSRQKFLTSPEVIFSPPPKLTSKVLRQTFLQILNDLDPYVNLPTDIVRKAINIEEKIAQLRERLAQEVSASFSEILQEAKDKTEIIVSFLALLELIKQKTVLVRQNKTFADITIERLKK